MFWKFLSLKSKKKSLETKIWYFYIYLKVTELVASVNCFLIIQFFSCEVKKVELLSFLHVNVF